MYVIISDKLRWRLGGEVSLVTLRSRHDGLNVQKMEVVTLVERYNQTIEEKAKDAGIDLSEQPSGDLMKKKKATPESEAKSNKDSEHPHKPTHPHHR